MMVSLGTLCSLSFAGRQGPPFFPPPAPTSYNSATDSWLLALFTLQVIAGANSVERLVALLVWAAPSPALDCDSTETEAHGAPPQFPTLAAPWCSFRLRKRAPADQEGHNRVCVCGSWVARPGAGLWRGAGAVWREPPPACSSSPVLPAQQTWAPYTHPRPG